jgi:hypothetical protein
MGGEHGKGVGQREVAAAEAAEPPFLPHLLRRLAGKGAVEVLAAKLVVAVVIENLQPPAARAHERDVERAAA